MRSSCGMSLSTFCGRQKLERGAGALGLGFRLSELAALAAIERELLEVDPGFLAELHQ